MVQVYLLVFQSYPAGSRPDREMGLLRWVGLNVQSKTAQFRRDTSPPKQGFTNTGQG